MPASRPLGASASCSSQPMALRSLGWNRLMPARGAAAELALPLPAAVPGVLVLAVEVSVEVSDGAGALDKGSRGASSGTSTLTSAGLHRSCVERIHQSRGLGGATVCNSANVQGATCFATNRPNTGRRQLPWCSTLHKLKDGCTWHCGMMNVSMAMRMDAIPQFCYKWSMTSWCTTAVAHLHTTLGSCFVCAATPGSGTGAGSRRGSSDSIRSSG